MLPSNTNPCPTRPALNVVLPTIVPFVGPRLIQSIGLTPPPTDQTRWRGNTGGRNIATHKRSAERDEQRAQAEVEVQSTKFYWRFHRFPRGVFVSRRQSEQTVGAIHSPNAQFSQDIKFLTQLSSHCPPLCWLTSTTTKSNSAHPDLVQLIPRIYTRLACRRRQDAALLRTKPGVSVGCSNERRACPRSSQACGPQCSWPSPQLAKYTTSS